MLWNWFNHYNSIFTISNEQAIFIIKTRGAVMIILPKIIFLLLIQSVLAQFPTDLLPDEISAPLIVDIEEENEFILTLEASANTDWSTSNAESATLVVAIDGDWENYNQDIVLYAGNTNHEYHVSLGYLSEVKTTCFLYSNNVLKVWKNSSCDLSFPAKN